MLRRAWTNAGKQNTAATATAGAQPIWLGSRIRTTGVNGSKSINQNKLAGALNSRNRGSSLRTVIAALIPMTNKTISRIRFKIPFLLTQNAPVVFTEPAKRRNGHPYDAHCMDNFFRVLGELRPTPSGRWGPSCSSSMLDRLLCRETDNQCVALHDSQAITRTVIGASSPPRIARQSQLIMNNTEIQTPVNVGVDAGKANLDISIHPFGQFYPVQTRLKRSPGRLSKRSPLSSHSNVHGHALIHSVQPGVQALL